MPDATLANSSRSLLLLHGGLLRSRTTLSEIDVSLIFRLLAASLLMAVLVVAASCSWKKQHRFLLRVLRLLRRVAGRRADQKHPEEDQAVLIQTTKSKLLRRYYLVSVHSPKAVESSRVAFERTSPSPRSLCESKTSRSLHVCE